MNALKIEEAISRLDEQPFEDAEFPFQFLEVFGNKPTAIIPLRMSRRLRAGDSVRHGTA